MQRSILNMSISRFSRFMSTGTKLWNIAHFCVGRENTQVDLKTKQNTIYQLIK